MAKPVRYWRERWAAGLSLALIAYIGLADWGFGALHRRGYAQGLLGFLDGLSAVLQAPGFVLAFKLRIRGMHHHTPPDVWFIVMAFNLVLWAIALWVTLHLLFPWRRTPVEPAAESPVGPRITRRTVLTSGVRLAAVSVASVGAYSVFCAPRWYEITRRSQLLRGLPPELDGLRIVQLTDIHHGPNLSLGYVRDIVRSTNELRSDLILLTGDYVYRSPRYIAPVVEALADLRATVGVAGVLGNHDWWEDATLTRQQFARVGIPLIDNTRLFVTPDRKLVRSSDAGLCIAGVGDYREDVVRFDHALAYVPEQMPRLLLSHNPDAAEDPELRRLRPRIDLMLCGHTHGGQVRLPFVGVLKIPSAYGLKYVEGLVHGPVCDVYISRGLGTTILPIRFRVPPEITVIELRSV